MVSAGVLQMVVLTCLASALPAEGENHLLIAPQSPVLEVGTNFTATCLIINTAEVTADDLYWNLSKTIVPEEQYTKINKTALNVTILITDETNGWLLCLCKKKSAFVVLNKGKFMHGINIVKGYRPMKPENLSCIALQEEMYISPIIMCEWKAVGRQTPEVSTTYTLFAKVILSGATFNASTEANHSEVVMPIFPNHMTLEFWVEAHNKLGRIESDHLKNDAEWFLKTNPPSPVTVMEEKDFPTSLLIRWKQPIVTEYVKLTYEIRFCPHGSHSWTYVPRTDTNNDITSFRLQNLQPYKTYVIQMRCKPFCVPEGQGYWSDWSVNTTKRTPEDRPRSKPDLWTVFGDSTNGRQVLIMYKDPVSANGRIIRLAYNITTGDDKFKNQSRNSVLVNKSDTDNSFNQREIIDLEEIHLTNEQFVRLDVTASNSVGKSPVASLVIPQKANAHGPVKELKVWPHGDQLWLEWKPPSRTDVSEYVVQWVRGNQIDWQRESRYTTQTAIKGNLERFVCYNVSVYPIYARLIGKPASVEAFLEQGVPLEGPVVRLVGRPGRNSAHLMWTEIPLDRRQGFITKYTIFCTSGTEKHSITVPGNITSYTLRLLSGNTKYDVCISASTVRGSANSTNHSFTTLKYATGEIELIIVGVSLGFLFVVVMTMLLCVYKKDMIKKNFWPQIPNPGESTIGNWSPDYPLKAETPKENCLSGISVLDMDVCDGKSMFEEDKASHPLRKDKYLSEEHSSGIGGSSCMSSPRQSVSDNDNDEGADMVDTTASTVQYSSVVASSGYKGQTPSSQPQQAVFARSESTQPLLDSEENPDMLVQEGSRQSRFSRQPCFTHVADNKDCNNPAEFKQLGMEHLEALDFCPLEEDSEQTTPTDDQSVDWLPAAPSSSYMPQLGGYRPQ